MLNQICNRSRDKRCDGERTITFILTLPPRGTDWDFSLSEASRGPASTRRHSPGLNTPIMSAILYARQHDTHSLHMMRRGQNENKQTNTWWTSSTLYCAAAQGKYIDVVNTQQCNPAGGDVVLVLVWTGRGSGRASKAL